MSFAYAAQTLTPIGADHLLGRAHNEPEEMKRLIAEEPAEVVRMALRSYGPLSVKELKETLVGELMGEEAWKIFWESARRALKSDALIELPSKRDRPIRLLDTESEYGGQWVSALRGERDPDRILELVEELSKADSARTGGERRDIMAERLGYVVDASWPKRPEWSARALMLAATFAGEDFGFEAKAVAERLLQPSALLQALSGIPARDVRPLIGLLSGLAGEDRVAEALLAELPQQPLNVVNDAIAFLIDTGREEVCAERVRVLVSDRSAGPAVLYSLCRKPDLARRWLQSGTAALLTEVVQALEQDLSGFSLKAQRQLRSLFDQIEWLKRMLADLDEGQREVLLKKISESGGWEVSAKRSVLGRMIRLYPELEQVLATPAEREGTDTSRRTSWRTYRERQEQLRRLIEVDIPANSREIAEARSYGDLSENFEYQAAKDQQRLLMRRQIELQRDLDEVRGSDFAGVRTDTAGAGTCVTLRGPEGSTRRFCILGEWDRDDELGIISSSSRLADLVSGCRVGDTVDVPSMDTGVPDGATERCTVAEIAAPGEVIRQWMGSRSGTEAGD
jgi:transcription elongation GreA/GreB family factor